MHDALDCRLGRDFGPAFWKNYIRLKALLNPPDACSPQAIAARLAALKSLGILDTLPERAFDDLAQLAGQCCGASVALISFLDERRQWFKAEIGLSLREMPIQIAVCAHAISSPDDVFVVPDLAGDERFSAFPYVQDGLRLRFYAGAPIRTADGIALGTICVLDAEPRPLGLAPDLRLALAALARVVADQLSTRMTNSLLRKSEQRYRALTAASSTVVWSASPAGDLIAVWLWEDFSRQTLEKGLAGDWAERVHPDDKAAILSLWAHNIAHGSIHRAEFRIADAEGSYRWVAARAVPIRDETGDVVEWIGALTDINEQRIAQRALIESEDHYRHAAHHDALTGLPNRPMFLERLEQAIGQAIAEATSVGVIYVDLDDFKDINDTLGHNAGDVVLIAVAERLQATIPADALAARIGGDEFAILHTAQSNPETLEALARQIKRSLATAVAFDGHELSCKASLGLTLYPHSDVRPGELTKNADLALYQAKRAGGNQYAFFTPEIRQVVQNRISALSCARDALSRNAILPFYQPKVSLQTGQICGFEALLRWEHPREGIQPPGLIKEAFDDPALSLALGKRMLDCVIKDMSKWRAAGLEFGSVAINLSADQFSRTDIAKTILNSLDDAGLKPSDIQVEVTESVFLGGGSEAVAHALDKLHEAGVQVALDDFGTGFASLTHLNKFPVSWLKIDQSFICDMGGDPNAAAIVAAIIGLSQSLGIQVVAEGVETQGQWDTLNAKGCNVAQGYLIAKAMPRERVAAFIHSWSPGGCRRDQQA